MWGSSFDGWGSSFDRDPFGDRLRAPRGNTSDSREGKVDAERFAAKDAAPRLGHGRIAVVSMPGSTASGSDEATYEAALLDQLAKAGYDYRHARSGRRVRSSSCTSSGIRSCPRSRSASR